MRYFALALVSAASVVGCVADAEEVATQESPVLLAYRIDASVSDPSLVRDAAATINRLVGRVVVGERAVGVPVTNVALHGLSGFHRDDGGIEIDEVECRRAGREHPREYALVVLMHEFGHALGLRHVRVDGSIMYPNTAWDSVWSSADQTECERAGVCSHR